MTLGVFWFEFVLVCGGFVVPGCGLRYMVGVELLVILEFGWIWFEWWAFQDLVSLVASYASVCSSLKFGSFWCLSFFEFGFEGLW